MIKLNNSRTINKSTTKKIVYVKHYSFDKWSILFMKRKIIEIKRINSLFQEN